jgi:hypothetical protein
MSRYCRQAVRHVGAKRPPSIHLAVIADNGASWDVNWVMAFSRAT